MLINIKLYTRSRVTWVKPVLCRIEIRDVGLEDAPADIIAVHDIMINELSEIKPYITCIEVPDEIVKNRSLAVWGHLSVTGSERIHPGDLITTSSYPIARNVSQADLSVELKPV